MSWNLLTITFAALLHFHPQYPLFCLRAAGPIALIISNDYVAHFFSLLMFICMCNCGLALAFSHRYFLFACLRMARW
ncbi:hypothetical protein QR680_010431 [Steinernema hermaphroditum]|uniref:Uncharacterized protein n=1 Tax=Steinernema hermaphroditum TaxID=289476 RepID=A0AA39IQ61_9BILA|nr:hypothetical protein QR680_010431 [Steinernema hermaphroditum]